MQVHITVNTLTVPFRKGVGNTPFVFLAQGASGSAIRVAHTVPSKDSDEAFSVVDDDDGGGGGFSKLPGDARDRWNRAEGFQKFLRREMERERALQRRNDATNASVTASAPKASARQSSETPSLISAPSSDDIVPSVSGDEYESDSSAYSAMAHSDSALFPFSFSSITPYPAHPLHRKRVERAKRRLSRLTQSGLVDMISSDEEEKRQKKKARKNHRGPETYARTKAVGRGGAAAPTGRGKAKVDVVVADEWDPFALSDDAEV